MMYTTSKPEVFGFLHGSSVVAGYCVFVTGPTQSLPEVHRSVLHSNERFTDELFVHAEKDPASCLLSVAEFRCLGYEYIEYYLAC